MGGDLNININNGVQGVQQVDQSRGPSGIESLLSALSPDKVLGHLMEVFQGLAKASG